MSSTEQEGTETTVEETLTPAGNLDDLFADEVEDEIEEPEIPENLSDEDLRKRVVAAEKSAKFERNERLKVARKTWVSEAKEHFPYADPDSIKADSRRTFLEAAKAQDASFRERAKPIIDKASKTDDELRAEVRAEVEAEYEKSWGRPFTSTSGSTKGAEEGETEKRLDGARKKRDLHGAVTALMDGRRI